MIPVSNPMKTRTLAGLEKIPPSLSTGIPPENLTGENSIPATLRTLTGAGYRKTHGHPDQFPKPPTESMNTPKQKYPREAADAVARELIERLKPCCNRIIVAGSLRRRKPEVGDVEILFIPKMETRKVDWFASESVSMAAEEIEAMVADGTLSRRISVSGAATWGDKNKLAVHRGGIPVDLFAATEATWFNYLVCRTGPHSLNIRIAEAAKRKLHQWNPYGEGFTDLRGGHTIAMDSERAVFEFVGIPFVEPIHRYAD